MSVDELTARLKRMEEEVNSLHTTLEGMGKNSKQVKSLDLANRKGTVFTVPVDEAHKATQDPLCVTLLNCSKPHMAAFHTSWFGFFSSFFSTFAAASLNAYIIPDLNLTNLDWGNANVASVTGTILFRLLMGWICDKFGARKGLGILLLGTTPAIVLMMFAQNAWQFILLRCVIGFSLATFVACQTWCSQMFSKKVVGIANATAAGWGNLGGGITNLLMPYIFLMFMMFTGDDESASWRLSFLIPLALHIIGGCWVLTTTDLPDGNYRELEQSGAKQKADSKTVIKVGASNVNALIFTLTYGMCFGIELTMNNVASRYFYAYQGLTPQLAGIAAACWGLMNIIARSMGGWLSDWANARFGMRGRLWACWIVQTLEGVMCILLGYVTIDYDAPDTDLDAVQFESYVNLGDDMIREQVGLPTGWVPLNATCFPFVGANGTEAGKLVAARCNTLNTKMDDGLRECLRLPMDVKAVLRTTAPPEFGGPADVSCVCNSGTVASVMVLVVCFSLCVQAAEGLHYGIVPYISRPALGIVSGMVGAGGNLGSVIALNIFFKGAYRTDQGIIYMGAMIMSITALMFGVYFPEHGSMLFKAGGLGSYDPQLIKPPDDYRGADHMDFENAKKTVEAANKETTTNGVPVTVNSA